MKNKLNIFLALALLVLTVFTFGCKAEVDLGGDAKKWNNLQSIGGNSENLLRIKADGYDRPTHKLWKTVSFSEFGINPFLFLIFSLLHKNQIFL